ncbi:MAG: recombinase family protein [Ruminococcus sp.]|nr:recombinase family protein [Ruminococcus sp.]
MIGIYARQSIEKKDSISVDMQVELCKQKVDLSNKFDIYIDKGFSGTTMKRPEFCRMMQDVQYNKLETVVVYKLDRISRSLSDFALMMRTFQQHNVKLISQSEQFDTDTPIGSMLLNLLVMFAELEQKTIASRIRDNYYARAEKQLPLGGVIPFGYIQKDNKVIPDSEESKIVRMLYKMYLSEDSSIEKLVHICNKSQIKTKSGAKWSNSSMLRLLRNPFYVKSNYLVYNYFQKKGANMVHNPEKYYNGYGCIIYGNPDGRHGSKFVHIKNENISAGNHLGIIDASEWLAVQRKCSLRSGISNRGSGNLTWLQGLLVCSKCKERFYARNNGKDKKYTYLVCRGKRLGICTGHHALRSSWVEKLVEPVLLRIIYYYFSYPKKSFSDDENNILQQIKILEDKITAIVRNLEEINSASIQYLNIEIKRLADEKQKLERKLTSKKEKMVSFQDVKKLWENANFSQKKQTAQLLIEKIEVDRDNIKIYCR